VVRTSGNKITLTLNGVNSVQYTENESGIADSGRIGLQLHSGGPMTVEFKDLYIQPLPRAQVDNSTTPGFHLRTLKTDKGERKYAIYIPNGYDGQRTFPAILFLHGSGERGEDGIAPAQVGIGPNILQNKDAYPAVVILPQAKETWAADSDDAKAALAALDDCLANLKIDKNRVALTGLSMGGRGAWEMAAKHPERFAAVVPICGPARPETATAMKTLPIWSVVGDGDRDTTVKGMRDMATALSKAGAKVKSTEYRGVGHNSWDRAYSDPALIDWLLSARRP
jgi:predicted peptidase